MPAFVYICTECLKVWTISPSPYLSSVPSCLALSYSFFKTPFSDLPSTVDDDLPDSPIILGIHTTQSAIIWNCNCMFEIKQSFDGLVVICQGLRITQFPFHSPPPQKLPLLRTSFPRTPFLPLSPNPTLWVGRAGKRVCCGWASLLCQPHGRVATPIAYK